MRGALASVAVLLWSLPLLGGRIPVAVSIPPLADFVAGVGGNRVEIEVLVPPGASPHTFTLEPAQMRFLSRARLLVVVGLGLEFWLEDAVAAAGNPDLEVVVASRGVKPLDSNPHVWLDPLLAVLQVANVRNALERIDPEHRLDYEINAARYIGRLLELDASIRRRVATWSHREFVAFHPAWAYFAARYGLIQAAVIESSPGKEPSPAEMARIIETVRRLKVRAIFAEPQFSPRAAQTIAAETGARVLFLDPLGGVPGRETYFQLMEYNLEQMEKALK